MNELQELADEELIVFNEDTGEFKFNMTTFEDSSEEEEEFEDEESENEEESDNSDVENFVELLQTMVESSLQNIDTKK